MVFLSHFRQILQQHFKMKGRQEARRRLLDSNIVNGAGHEVEAVESMMTIMMMMMMTMITYFHV